MKIKVIKTKESRLKARILKLEKQLQVAIRTLQYYSDLTRWEYRGVKCNDESTPNHGNPYYTSFETIPLQDGWEWARRSLAAIERIKKGRK